MPGVHASLDHIATAVVIVRIVVAVRVVSVVVIRVAAEAEAATEVAIAIMKSTAAETTIAIVESTTIVESAAITESAGYATVEPATAAAVRYRFQPRRSLQVAIVLRNCHQLRRSRYSILREPRLIEFKFGERVAGAARSGRFHCCRCNLIPEFRNKKRLPSCVRRGLLTPETNGKGGRNPYQVFTAEHVHAAKFICTAQSFGLSLKVAAIGKERQVDASRPKSALRCWVRSSASWRREQRN
jgi:hypothetical protein